MTAASICCRAGFAALAFAALANAAALELETVVEKLAREPPAFTPFREARFSSLLREPVVVAGELAYLPDGVLERRVQDPAPETTTIRGESVTVARDGEPPRTFGLRRAEELKGFLDAFTGLLAGDAARLQRSFAVTVAGDEQSWALALIPAEGRAKRRVQEIRVTGRGGELECFAIVDFESTGSVMLLGHAADTAVAADASLESLLAQCRAE